MKRTRFFLVPVVALLFMGLVLSGAWANEFARIADNATIQLLDSNGNAVTNSTKVKYGDTLTIVADGLKPNTDYSVQLGWTNSSTGINLTVGNGAGAGKLQNPSLGATNANYDVRTDANGHFSIQFVVGDIACDSSDASRTLTVHEGTGTSPGSPVLSASPFGIQPVITLTLDNEAAYGLNATWSMLGFNATQGKVTDTAGNPMAAATDCPYTLAVHGFSGTTGYRKISFTMGGEDVPLWNGARVTSVTLSANGSLAAATQLGIPEIPAGNFPIVGIDGAGNSATYNFTVIPALLYKAGAGTDDPANDVEILKNTQLTADQGQQIQSLSGIGFPSGTISANSIQIGGKAATHTSFTVDNKGTFSAQNPTVSASASVGLQSIVIGSNTFDHVIQIGSSTANSAAQASLASTNGSVGDVFYVGVSNLDDNAANTADDKVYYYILNNAGNANVTAPTNSTLT